MIAATTSWLERVVIGLNLCPFAKAVHAKKQIRFFVSAAIQRDKLLCDLKQELSLLASANPEQIESTLLRPHQARRRGEAAAAQHLVGAEPGVPSIPCRDRRRSPGKARTCCRSIPRAGRT